jgi:hypothetical protein
LDPGSLDRGEWDILLNGYRFHSAEKAMFWKERRPLHSIVSVLNTAQFSLLNGYFIMWISSQ